jgi:Domain of unknown function (DUF4136)
MNTASKIALLSLAAVLLTACASAPKVRVDKDATVNFANYKTFAWLALPKEPAKEEPKPIPGQDVKPAATPEANSLVENRVRAAVIAALQAKGYTLNEAAPDFRVSYVFNVYERPKDSGMSIGIGAGGGSRNVRGGVGFSIPIGKRTNMMGAMTIDIIDVPRNAQVWTGSYEDRVEDGGLSDASAGKLVTTILARFPTDVGK